jgi:PilZ domain
MADRIVNPRRVPRAPARCEVTGLLEGGGHWATDTIDIGPNGCQLIAPGRAKAGDPLKLLITNERVGDALAVLGRVAWARSTPPWRIGVAFEAESVGDATRWFDALLAAYPGLATYHLAPDAIETSATVRLGRVPRLPPELSTDEIEVLKEVGAGATVASLRTKLGSDWPAFEGMLFALVGRKLLTLDAAEAGAPAGWAAYLR